MSESAVKPLPVLPLWRDVLRVYAKHWWLLVPLALLVLLPQAIADAALADIEIGRVRKFSDLAQLAEIPLAVAINLGGEALYAGIIAAVVLRWRSGERVHHLGAVARSIPYRRLIVLDLLIAVGAAAGFALLLVPGLVLFVYIGASPALLKLQDLSVGGALRKSVNLVRGNFWRVLIFTGAVALVTDSLTTALESPIHGLTGEVIYNLAIEAAVEPFQGLATVLLALALLELRGETVSA